MSNPAKALKKLVKIVLVVAVIAAVAYVALPAISSAMGAGAAAGGSAATTAVGSTAAGGAAAAAGGAATAATAGTAAAAGGGLLSGVGSAIAGASPLVKLGLIQAGTQFAAGAMQPEEQTQAEMLQDQMNVYHSQPSSVINFGTSGQQLQPAQAGLVSQAGMNSEPVSQYKPQATAASPGLVSQSSTLGRYNPETRKWEQS